MSYKDRAMREFRAAGWVDENGKFDDEFQESICKHIMDLLDVFHDEGHSGTTAPYTVNLFSKLAMFEPIVPLTGEDWEWTDLGYTDDIKYQNKRCGHVFKDANGRAWDGNGKVFWEWYTGEDGVKRKSHYTCSESRVYIEFPYTPTIEYVYRESGAE